MNKFKEGDKVVITEKMYYHLVGKIVCICNDGYYLVSTSPRIVYGSVLKLHESSLCLTDIPDECIGESIDEEVETGTIIDEYFTEMATVKGGFMSIKLAIYGGEGRYPHFHFYKGIAPEQGISKEKRNGGGCICIDSANYFIHGNHTDILERKEIDGLIKFLQSPHRLLKKYTNWEYIISEWDQNNPNQKQLPIDLPMPNYRHDMRSIQEK